jgi:hypothetical protein
MATFQLFLQSGRAKDLSATLYWVASAEAMSQLAGMKLGVVDGSIRLEIVEHLTRRAL